MSNKIKVGLVQINYNMNVMPTGLDKQKLRWGSLAPRIEKKTGLSVRWATLPYTVGLLQAHAQKYSPNPERFEFLLPAYKRLPVEETVENLLAADVVGFSVYVWNMNRSLAIAKQLKERRPGVVIVFGGPHVPARADTFLKQHPYIDVVCHGEGEQVFLSILENSQERSWEGIPSISYLLPDGSCVRRPQAPRCSDLTGIPSPYLEGVFEPLIEANPQEKWTVLWETNRGCPFSCTFCDLGMVSGGRPQQFEMERLAVELDWMATHAIEAIAICDANFGILPRDLEIAQTIVELKRKYGHPRMLFLNIAKGATERIYRIQKLLSASRLNGKVVISLQSTDISALKNTKRKNMSLTSFHKLQQRFKSDGVMPYTELILGLPGETYNSFANGISQVMQTSSIFLYNCLVLPNARMAQPEYQKQFGIHTVLQEIVTTDSPLRDTREVREYQEIIIATDSLPREDWTKAKAFGWMTDLLYFDRLLQIPLVLLHELYAVSYRELIDVVCQADPKGFPVLSEVASIFREKAEQIQNGGPEYFPSEEYLAIWWPADQYVLIKLAIEGKIQDFYHQAKRILTGFMEARTTCFEPTPLHEAIELNLSLLRLPFYLSDFKLELSHNILEFYQAALARDPIHLEQRTSRYSIYRTLPILLCWEDWMEFIMICHGRKDMYLFKIQSLEIGGKT